MARTGVILIALFALGSLGCSTAKMPAISDTATQTTLQGKVVWHDLITDVPEASKHFYQTLFGWEFEEVSLDLGWFNSVNYTLIRLNGRLIGGMVDQTQLQSQNDISQWINSISVADVDAAVAILKDTGGQVITAPVDLAERGRLAVVTDPQAALFTLLQTNDQDPLDDAAVSIGDFLWDELWTEDINAASGFYTQLAGYADEDSLVQDDLVNTRYRVLRSQDKPRAGILKMPVDGLSPIWVSYLRVADAASLDAIIARVEALGGTILLDPQDREIGGRVALIAGPSGAGIALQTWPVEAQQ